MDSQIVQTLVYVAFIVVIVVAVPLVGVFLGKRGNDQFRRIADSLADIAASLRKISKADHQ